MDLGQNRYKDNDSAFAEFISASQYFRKYARIDTGYVHNATPSLDPNYLENLCYILYNKHIDIKAPPLPLQTTITTAQFSPFGLSIKPSIIDKVIEDKKKLIPLMSLQELYKECSSPGWDGYDAQPIPKTAYEEARRFLKMLPSSISIPEISSEPTGSIAFEWYKTPERILVASISGNHTIEYAGLFGNGNKSYGTESLKDVVPNTFLHLLYRLLGG